MMENATSHFGPLSIYSVPFASFRLFNMSQDSRGKAAPRKERENPSPKASLPHQPYHHQKDWRSPVRAGKGVGTRSNHRKDCKDSEGYFPLLYLFRCHSFPYSLTFTSQYLEAFHTRVVAFELLSLLYLMGSVFLLFCSYHDPPQHAPPSNPPNLRFPEQVRPSPSWRRRCLPGGARRGRCYEFVNTSVLVPLCWFGSPGIAGAGWDRHERIVIRLDIFIDLILFYVIFHTFSSPIRSLISSPTPFPPISGTNLTISSSMRPYMR